MSETVFVLGAGASMPFGFPSGEGLITKIFEELKCHFKTSGKVDPTKDQVLLKMLLEQFEYNFIENFLNSLLKSQTNSIDNFLSHNSQYREIGKMCIFYIILKYEKNSLVSDKLWNGNWYKYIWNILDQQNFHSNFCIYTFNYDRSFEYYFYSTIQNLNNLTNEETKVKFDRLKIRHLHGSLGNIFPGFSDSLSYGDLTKFNSYDALIKSSKSIEVIYEVENKKDVFSDFRKECSDASNIIFLGFGFNQENVDRIGLRNVEHKKIGEYFPVMIGGTCFQLTELEIKMKTRGLSIGLLRDHQYRISKPNFVNADCLNFLREAFDCSQLIK